MTRHQNNQGITKIKFYQIARDIKAAVTAGTYKADQVAADRGVGVSTVRTIKRTGTWPKFVEFKQARRKRAVELDVQRGKRAVVTRYRQGEKPLVVDKPTVATPTRLDQCIDTLQRLIHAQGQTIKRIDRRVAKLETWRDQLIENGSASVWLSDLSDIPQAKQAAQKRNWRPWGRK